MEQALSESAAALQEAGATFGPRLEAPLSAFRDALHQAAKLEAAEPAARTPESTANLCSVLDRTDEAVEALPLSDVLFDQITVVAAAAAALGWVCAPDAPPDYVASVCAEVADTTAKLRKMTHPGHAAFADAADAFLSKLKEYVDQHAPLPLTLAPPAQMPPDQPAA